MVVQTSRTKGLTTKRMIRGLNPENPVILDNDDPKILAARGAGVAQFRTIEAREGTEFFYVRFPCYSGLSRTTASPEKLSQTG